MYRTIQKMFGILRTINNKDINDHMNIQTYNYYFSNYPENGKLCKEFNDVNCSTLHKEIYYKKYRTSSNLRGNFNLLIIVKI